MKKVFIIIACLHILTLDAKNSYVDLGLSSGTLWNDHIEKGFYTYDEALHTYGNFIPTQEQMQELKNECKWEWISNAKEVGYAITGPNGESIFLPAAGYGGVFDMITDVNTAGFYWSRTIANIYDTSAWSFRFYDKAINIDTNGKNAKQSIILVKHKY